MPKAIVPASEIQSWWRGWREEDFSWNGLARKSWLGWSVNGSGELIPDDLAGETDRSATLQDYWAFEADHLVNGPDGEFTEFHLPLHWSDDSDTLKSSWSRRRCSAIFGRLASQIKSLKEKYPDHQIIAPLDGVVFPHLLKDNYIPSLVSEHDTLSLSISAVCGKLNIGNVDTIEQLELNNCLFLGPFRIDDISFRELVMLHKCLLVGPFRIQTSKMINGLAFSEAAFFGPVRILACEFNGEVAIEDCVFANSVSLATGTANAGVMIEKTRFLGQSTFSRFGFNSEVYVSETVFAGPTRWVAAKFPGEVNFYKVHFGPANFSRAEFEDHVSFEESTFSEIMEFSHVHFAKYASFRNSIFPSDAGMFTGAFRDARFSDGANFVQVNFYHFAAFDEATFKRPPLLNDDERGDWPFAKAVSLARRASLSSWRRPETERQQMPLERAREYFFGALEGGCRSLKLAMEAKRARALEQKFYRYELRARQSRPSTGPSERIVSAAFYLSSNFGHAIFRPIFLTGFVLLAFGLAFALIHYLAVNLPQSTNIMYDRWYNNDDLARGINLSGRQVFRPFSIWDIGTKTIDPWENDILIGGGFFIGLATRLAGTLESMISIGLLFMSGLAIKRRFQLG
ncbi:hypothetical protein QO010_003417 [Caulobacter ginsengisoli]|uniref:Pentapeptide repeat-containing protein n=1 Tax=Caulobacter ginsengisoli TaxID=400775 RepID=A0ABU0IWS4_9CAUL|nr:pentapeptide repeat-containing protein [Caulobacter ginsengisoli]MDQ0465628.1 hypothetical protein [Caulobacter ginsengisoli]